MDKQILISDIQKFAVNDGPGFRTIVFLKGCTMRCEWCHNPETLATYQEIYWKNRLCVQCGACLAACPKQAINPPIDPAETKMTATYHKIDRSKCDRCMKCVSACGYDALTIVGRSMSVDEILDEVEKDRPFYNNSGGGMTLSGGEPTMHPDFSSTLLRNARLRGIHTCLQTNGNCDWQTFRQVAEEADIVLFDLKHIDPVIHENKTSLGNKNVLANIAILSKAGKEIWVRIPVIPGFNDSTEFHTEAAKFLSSLPNKIKRLDLLPYHNWCQDKYGWLGVKWQMEEIEALDPSFLEIWVDLYRERGLQVTVGGSGFEKSELSIG